MYPIYSFKLSASGITEPILQHPHFPSPSLIIPFFHWLVPSSCVSTLEQPTEVSLLMLYYTHHLKILLSHNFTFHWMLTTLIFSIELWVPYFQTVQIYFYLVILVLSCLCVPNQTQLTSDCPFWLAIKRNVFIQNLEAQNAISFDSFSLISTTEAPSSSNQVTVPLLYSHCHHLMFRSGSLLRFTLLNPPKKS